MKLITVVQQYAIVLVVGLLFLPRALAYLANGDYLPFRRSQLGTIFPQICVADDVSKIKYLTVNGVDCKYKSAISELDLNGKDRLGSHWSLKLNVSAAGGSIWKADLDQNGEADLVILLWSGACGIAPRSRLAFVMFDKTLGPKVWLITGYFSSVAQGVEDLRKLPGEKGAVLIEQILTYDNKANNHYWRTTAWQPELKKWNSLKQFQSIALPAFTLYKYKPNHKIANLKWVPKVTQADDAAVCPAQKTLFPYENFSTWK